MNYTEQQTCQPPKRANLETLQKSPEKPGDWDLKPGDFQNMCKMKIKMVDFLFQGILYLICATYCILFPAFFEVSFCFAVDARRQFELTIRSSSFPRDLSTPILTYGSTGMRSELYPAFPQTLDVTNLAIFNTVFQYCFILPELFDNFKIF